MSCIYHTVPISITPSGRNTAGEQYQLTCTFTSSLTNTPSISWLGPPNGKTLPGVGGDTRMVKSSGSAHTSILQFDPLQSSHEGNYTCQVTVGTVTEMRSIQVSVETPVSMTDNQQPTTRPGDGDSSKKPGGGGSMGAIAGGVIIVLLVVGVVILLAVILLLYWRYRYVCYIHQV